MKSSGFVVLSIAFIVSLILHFMLFRLIRYEPEKEDREIQRYEVRLVYYEKPTEGKKETGLKRTNRKNKKNEQKKKVVAEEALQEKNDIEEQPMQKVEKRAEPAEQSQPEETAFAAPDIVTSNPGQLSGNPATRDTRVQEQPDFSSVISGLRNELMKKKVYPYAARKKGMEGVAVVFIRLDADGTPLEIRLARSSGHRILDNAAVRLVKKVLPYRHNTGHTISFEIPIKYSLVE